MMDITGWVVCTDCARISTCSPVAEVKRTASESPYTSAVATNRRRDAIALGLTMLFPIIFLLRPVGCGHRDDLADRRRGCARAIAVPVERLLLTPVSPPIARALAGQLPECRSERGLRGIAKRGCDR